MNRRAFLIPLSAAVALQIAAPQAAAQKSALWQECHEMVEVEPAQGVIACNIVIRNQNANGDTPERRAAAYTFRGNHYAKQKEYKLAIDDYDEALRISPGFANAISNREKVLAAQGKK